MKTTKLSLTFILCALLFSCSSDDASVVDGELLPSDKSITKFEFKSLHPDAVATIDGTTVEVQLRMGTNATSLIPIISVSDGAKISPASDIVQDFTEPVTYTVTAKDGSTKIYTVIVTVRDKPTFTVGNVIDGSATEFEGYVFVAGSNFDDFEFANVVLTDINNPELTYTLPIDRAKSNEARLAFRVADVDRGGYSAMLHVGTQYQTIDDVKVRRNWPVIVNVNKYKFAPGETITLAGNYFKSEGNKVWFSQGADGTNFRYLDVISESENSLVVKLPEDADIAEYFLEVRFSEDGDNYDAPCNLGRIFVKEADSDEPEIISIDRRTINHGQTVYITGLNLKKDGATTNIVFRNNTNQIKTVRAAQVNSDGTEVMFKVPSDFAANYFNVWIEVGENSSNAMTDIQVAQQ